LSYEDNTYKLCPAKGLKQANWSWQSTWWVLAVGAPCGRGQRPPAAAPTCCLGKFAACQGLGSGHCGKAAADYDPLLLFHTGTNDDARGNQESIKH